jgi:glucokinase
MFLGIEIGGTKLQLGVGAGDGRPLLALERYAVDRERRAEELRRQIKEAGRRLIGTHGIRAAGVGFGGPVDVAAGQVVTSFHVQGWNGFPLRQWCRDALGVPTSIANDADTAGLAEARFGAGRGHNVVFYITVGSGIGGGLVIRGELYQGGGGIASELGHMRPGLDADQPGQIVESIASGWGIANAVRARLDPGDPDTADLLRRCEDRPERLNTQIVAQAASGGNGLAGDALRRACQTLGWAIAQMITLVAPDIVVVGGGVSLIGEEMFFAPLRREVARYVYPPLRGSYSIVPAALGEEVVLHGALVLAGAAAREIHGRDEPKFL